MCSLLFYFNGCYSLCYGQHYVSHHDDAWGGQHKSVNSCVIKTDLNPYLFRTIWFQNLLLNTEHHRIDHYLTEILF